jgi:hypothetical protein
MQSRIIYIERKDDGISGPASIGRVAFSQTGRSVYHQGRRFQKAQGFKSNYIEMSTGAEYWISGCKKRGGDRLYPRLVEIDADVLEEYWVQIRNLPERKGQKVIRCKGKYGGE